MKSELCEQDFEWCSSGAEIIGLLQRLKLQEAGEGLYDCERRLRAEKHPSSKILSYGLSFYYRMLESEWDEIENENEFED